MNTIILLFLAVILSIYLLSWGREKNGYVTTALVLLSIITALTIFRIVLYVIVKTDWAKIIEISNL